jgi:dTDP-4-amino-4,6-dideoxygalactose transaminase
MEAIGRLAKQYGVAVIEDASHAIGAHFAGAPVGSCLYSDCAVFSFHPVKIVTTGEGGVIVTNRDDLASRLQRLRSHGITRDPALMTAENPGPWHYEQIELGYNYRMTDIQAALGASQMDRLQKFIDRRQALAARYSSLLADLPLQLPVQDPRAASSWHLYVIRLRLDAIRRPHREVFDALRCEGIGVNLHYIPVHLQPYYRALGFKPGYCPEAERYHGEAISLPLYPDLSEADQDYIAATLRRLLA